MNSRKTLNTNNTGSILIELAVSLAILSFTLATMVLGSLNAQESVARSSLRRQALYLAESLLDYSLTTKSATGSSSVSLTGSTSLSYITPCLQNIEARVLSGQSRYATSISLSSIVFDKIVADSVMNDCHGYPTPLDWSHLYQPSKDDFANTTSLQSLDIFNNLLALGGVSNATSSPSFFLLNSDHDSLTSISSLQAGNINALDMAGSHVYLATQGTTSQVRIIDVSDTLHPIIVATSTLPSVTGLFPSGLSIKYYDSKLYVGVHRTAGNEFHIYNVSNPRNPAWLGSIELNHNINDIAVRGQYAYLATSGNTNDLIVLNIATSSSIVRVTSVSFTGSEDAISLFLLGDDLYVGRKKSTDPTHPSLVLLDVHDPLLPLIKNQIKLPNDITGITGGGLDLFITTTKGLYLVSRDLYSSQKISDMPGTALDYEENKLIVASSSSVILLNAQI